MKIYRQIIIGGYMLASASLSFSADWEIVSQGSDLSVLVDKQSVARIDNNRKAWVISSYNTEKGKDSYPYKPYKSTKSLLMVSCSDRTMGTMQAIYFADEYANTSHVHHDIYKKDRIALADVVPDSIGESVLNHICSIKLKSQKTV